MSKRGGTSYDDIFETDESRAESQLERVQNISISELVPFKDHPFKVVDDEAMLRTTESIAQYGVLTPLIARPLEGGGYEIISGHRRAHAAEMAGLTEVPVLVRQMDDDAATVLMVDSNLQRENILPSERAYAYKMKLEAIRRSTGRKSEINKDEKGTANIQANQMINHNTRIEQALRLVVLNDETLKLYLDDRVDTLFRDSTVSHEALQSFEDYVRGGIDVLYEELIDVAMTQEIAILRIRNLIAKIDLELGSVNKDKIIQSYRRL